MRYDDDYGSRNHPNTRGEALSDIVTSLTIIELLDALESGIVSLQPVNGAHAPINGTHRHAHPPVPVTAPSASVSAAPVPPLQEAGISASEFSVAFGIGHELLQRWLDGAEPAPSWVEASIHILGALPPSLRRMLVERNGRHPASEPNRSHPFSRIEEL